MGLDPDNIYVDLSGPDIAGPAEDNGAPLCGQSSVNLGGPPTGTPNYPLSFEQFRKYVQYRLDENVSGITTRTFYIRGSITTTIDYGAGGENTGVFNIRNILPNTNDELGIPGYTVKFTNWTEGESYKMHLSFTTSADINDGTYNPSMVFINSGDVRIEINNMDLQGGTFDDSNTSTVVGDIKFQNDSSTWIHKHHNNKIILNNCRLLTNGGGRYYLDDLPYVSADSAFNFIAYSDVSLYNTIFYSSTAGNCINIRDYYTKPNDNNGEDVYDWYLRNSIFLNITDIFRVVNGDSFRSDHIDAPDIQVQGCVFSGPSAGYFDSIFITQAFRNLLPFSSIPVDENQFGFSIPSLTWNINTLTDSDYNYLANGWQLIDTDANRFSSVNAYTYGERRDGVGALYFGEMATPAISASDFLVEIGDDVTLGNSVLNFDTDYLPSYYFWNLGFNDTYTTTASQGEVVYTIEDNGVLPVIMTVYSHNEWYSKRARTQLRSVIDTDIITFDLNFYDLESGDEINTVECGNSFSVSVTNTTSGSDIVDTVILRMGNNSYRFNTSEIGDYLDNKRVNYRYYDIGLKTVTLEVYTTDGRVVIFDKNIDVIDIIRDPYYVDLSIEYSDDKWLDLNYGIYDDFEDGTISTDFSSEFRNNYNVISMRDEQVANGVAQSSVIIGGIKFGEFRVEWSFVRTEVDDIPDMFIVIDDNVYRFDWDYISDAINAYDGDYKQKIVYGNFIKDLSCPNAFDTIQIKVEFVPDSDTTGTLKMYYITDGDEWIYSGFSRDVGLFTNATVLIEGTENTGAGYIGIQAEEIDDELFTGQGNGSEEFPFTYEEFYDRVKFDADNEISAIYGDTFMCRNWRKVRRGTFNINRDLNFHINVWNPHLYGPWMLVFDNMRTDVDFAGTTLSNGIIYNTSVGDYDLYVTTTYDMFIVWNNSGRIGLYRYTGRYTGIDERVDIIGSTIKSVNGFYTESGLNFDTDV